MNITAGSQRLFKHESMVVGSLNQISGFTTEPAKNSSPAYKHSHLLTAGIDACIHAAFKLPTFQKPNKPALKAVFLHQIR